MMLLTLMLVVVVDGNRKKVGDSPKWGNRSVGFITLRRLGQRISLAISDFGWPATRSDQAEDAESGLLHGVFGVIVDGLVLVHLVLDA